jgi:Mg2+ and Co2+ transporter CorA
MVFRDVCDHRYRATERLDTRAISRWRCSMAQLAIVANRTPHGMRVLTTVARFILPLSRVMGWFAMNFRALAGLGFDNPSGSCWARSDMTIPIGLFLRGRGWR